MIITISGKTSVGKNTVAEILAKKTGFKLLCFSFKDFLNGKNIVDFEKSLNGDFDREFDSFIKREVLSHKNENLIVVSRLSAIILEDLADLKVFLYADKEVRANRLAHRNGLKIEEAKKLLDQRDSVFENRIKKVYGIDYTSPKYYDLIINTNNKSPEDVVNMLIRLI